MDSKSLHQFDGENTGHQYPPVTLNDNARLHQGDYHFHYYAGMVELKFTAAESAILRVM